MRGLLIEDDSAISHLARPQSKNSNLDSFRFRRDRGQVKSSRFRGRRLHDQAAHKDELVALIHAIVRRSKGHAQSVVRIGDIILNLDNKTIEVGGARINFTSKEYRMLELLMLHKDRPVTKEMFLNHLYGGMDEPEVKIAKAGEIDLVIMDVGLPDVDGREAVRILRMNGFKAPIIMLTGHDTDSDTFWGLSPAPMTMCSSRFALPCCWRGFVHNCASTRRARMRCSILAPIYSGRAPSSCSMMAPTTTTEPKCHPTLTRSGHLASSLVRPPSGVESELRPRRDADEIARGEHVQDHLGRDLRQALHQKARCPHPHLESSESFFFLHRAQLAARALRYAVPAIYHAREIVEPVVS
jgi:CheY-like chemotaxis protein